MALVLRETVEAALPAVIAIESATEVARWVTVWPHERHRRAISDPDEAHLTAADGEEIIGFVLLAGLAGPHRSVELRRIAIARRSAGLGRKTLNLALELAFGHYQAHRVWLDVLPDNERARRLYISCGFVQEGLLREAHLHPDGSFSPLLLMSTLRTDREAG
jgi:RimJ/RimL family protein N-acetyltransferase